MHWRFLQTRISVRNLSVLSTPLTVKAERFHILMKTKLEMAEISSSAGPAAEEDVIIINTLHREP